MAATTLQNGESSLFHRLASAYPKLKAEASSDFHDLLSHAQLMEIPVKSRLMRSNDPCTHFMFVLKGTVRVFQDTEDGREMTLYRINPGDVCMMTLSSLINDRPFKAHAESETDIEVMMLKQEHFQHAMDASAAFRQLVLSSLLDSMCDMMHTFYDTAFSTLDMRLSCKLGQLFEQSASDTIYITHNELAQELGTSREVISRILKKLEKEDCIVLARGQIKLGSKSAPLTRIE